MRVYRSSRRAAALAATAATAAVLFAASPASADATVSPATAPQGAGANLTIRVVNDHPTAAITRIRLALPTDTPIADVYPLSVPNWAPRIISRTLKTPMQSSHGSPVTEATASITWTAAKGKSLPPGKAANVKIAIGPLPTSERMSFTVLPTYSDKSAGPAIPPAVLSLASAESLGVTPAEHGAASHGAAPITSDLITSEPNAGGPGVVNIVGWLIALLTGAAGVVLMIRSRRVTPTPAAPPTPARPATALSGKADVTNIKLLKLQSDKRAAAPRARVSAWSYRDGP